MARHLRGIAIFLLGCLWSSVLHAQTAVLGDPTRPSGTFADGAAEGDDGMLRLQSVLMPQGGKPVAIISGQMVRLGGRIGEMRLVRLNETEAVLQGPKGVERLFLTPIVTKTGGTGSPAPRLRDKKEKS